MTAGKCLRCGSRNTKVQMATDETGNYFARLFAFGNFFGRRTYKSDKDVEILVCQDCGSKNCIFEE